MKKSFLILMLACVMVFAFAAPAMAADTPMTHGDMAALVGDITIPAEKDVDDALTQEEAVAYVLLWTGMTADQLGVYPTDWNAMALSAAIVDLDAFDPTAVCTKAEVEAIKDSIKAEMADRDLDELEAGSYIVRYKTVATSRFDSTAFTLISVGEKRDTIIEPLTFIPDSISPRKWRVHSNWQPKRKYKLHIPTDALADITGEGNDSLDMNITVSDIEKYATLVLNVNACGPESEYIIQITDATGKTLRELQHVGAGKHTLNYVPVSDLKIRIIDDQNRNGRWDSGNMVERRQSERAEFYKNEQDEELFTTKTGWEFEFTLDMNSIFAPITMEQLIERLDQREAQRLIKAEQDRQKALQQLDKQHNHNHNSGGMLGGGMGGMLGGSGMGGMLGGIR